MLQNLVLANRGWKYWAIIAGGLFLLLSLLLEKDPFAWRILLALGITLVFLFLLRLEVWRKDIEDKARAEKIAGEKSRIRTLVENWSIREIGFHAPVEIWPEGPNWIGEFTVEGKTQRVLVHHGQVYILAGDS